MMEHSGPKRVFGKEDEETKAFFRRMAAYEEKFEDASQREDLDVCGLYVPVEGDTLLAVKAIFPKSLGAELYFSLTKGIASIKEELDKVLQGGT